MNQNLSNLKQILTLILTFSHSGRRNKHIRVRGIQAFVVCLILTTLYLLLTPTPALAGELANQFTISIWVNPATSIASKALVVKDSEIRLTTDASGNPLCQIYASGAWQTAVTSSTALTLNSWAHVSCTYNKANIYVYVNGTQTGSGAQTNAVNDAATNLLTGQDDSGTYTNFIGTTDHLQVYNYARTQKQVIEDMGGGHPGVTAGGLGGLGALGGVGRTGGAVGYWKFDEGHSTTANNSGSGGSALNGTLTGMATAPSTTTSGWTQAGKFNRALNFDGSNDYVNITDNNALDLGQGAGKAWTISVWYMAKGTGTGPQGIVAKRTNSSANSDYILYTENSTLIWGTGSSDDSCAWGGITEPSRNVWHHVIGTLEASGTQSGTKKMYVDGVLVKNCNYTIKAAATTDDLRIGVMGTPVNYYLNGQIDEVKIYPYALTADEVKLDYNKGSSQVLGALSDNSSTSFTSSSSVQGADHEYCIPGDSTSCVSPVGRWDFDEGAGASVKDVSGNGYNGTITGATYKLGKIGKALNFNGSTDVVDTISSIPGIQTISFWVNPSTTTQNLIDLQTTPGTINVSVSGGALSATGFTSPTYYINGMQTTSPTLTANAWSHVEITTGTAITGSAIRFGRISTTSLTGRLDNIRFFNYARSGAQVAWDYNRGAPVAHWKFDECQGDTAHDSSGNSNHGTINLSTTGTQTTAIGMGTCTASASTPWYNGRTGKFNYSLNFDGTDDYVNVSTDSKWALANMTVSAWIKTTSTSLTNVLGAFGSDSGEQWQFAANYSNATGAQADTYRFLYAHDGGYQEVYKTSSGITNNGWHHLVGVVNSSNLMLYIDGAAVHTVSRTVGNIAGVPTLQIGRNSSTYYFNGQIDDVRVYNYALTATQVKLLSNQGAAVRYGPFLGVP